MKDRLNLNLSLLCLIFLLAFFGKVNASHILGGDIGFTKIGPQAYMIQMTLYRDCSGVQLAGQAQQVNLVPLAGGNNITATLNPVGAQLEVNNCAGLITYCQNPASAIPGVEKYVFQGIVTVPVPNVDYEIQYNTCCRSGSIGNLLQPGGESVVLKTLLRDGINDNSAYFDPLTYPFVCVGQANAVSFHATDADGDSLVYSLVAADGGAGSVVYTAGASFFEPILGAPGQFLDQTGLFNFTTQTIQNSVVAVRVTEYRSGQLVGYAQRDLTSMIIACQASCGTNIIRGKVFRDNDQDCLSGAGDQNLNGWMVRLDPGPYLHPTNLNGEYVFAVDSGSYTVSPVLPSNAYWQVDCPPSGNYNIAFSGNGALSDNNDFGLTPSVLCAEMWVDIGSSVIRPCSLTVYNVSYCNQGTDTAWGAYVTVDLDANLTYVSSSIALGSSTGNSFTFPIGNIAPGFCSNFSINAMVACNTNLVNQTLCAEAHVYPDSVCQPISGAWDRSSLVVNGQCQDSLVCFTIENTGSPSNGNMTGPTDWRLYENGNLIQTGTLQLCGGCDTTFCFTANGNTLRFEVDQRPGHPGNSHPNASIELCGSPGNTVGLINALPQDDEDLFVSIDCRVVSNSYDPNHKSVSPSGLTDQYHYIDSTDVLEYLVDFQNLGTGPAYDVVIEDVIDNRLDIMTLQMGASSHPYTYTIEPGPKLRVEFKSIMLPAAVSNYDASMGWFKYSIKQNPGNQFMDQINNRADIYFDFNAPVLTNVTTNTIGWPEAVYVFPSVDNSSALLKIFPNPSKGDAILRVEGIPSGADLEVRVLDVLGREKAFYTTHAGNDLSVQLPQASTGVYFVQVSKGGRLLGVTRMVIQ